MTLSASPEDSNSLTPRSLIQRLRGLPGGYPKRLEHRTLAAVRKSFGRFPNTFPLMDSCRRMIRAIAHGFYAEMKLRGLRSDDARRAMQSLLESFLGQGCDSAALRLRMAEIEKSNEWKSFLRGLARTEARQSTLIKSVSG